MKMAKWGILSGLVLDVECDDISKFSAGNGYFYSGLSIAYDTTGRVAALNHLRNSITQFVKRTQVEHDIMLTNARESWKICK